MASLTDRMIRAARLDVNLYEEVEHDETAMTQAVGVVALSSLAGGVGSVSAVGVGGLVIGTVLALLGWYLWALLVYLIGTRLLPEAQTEADMGQVLRTLGFASAPGVVRVAGILPGLFSVVSLVASVWMLVAMVIAVRQALDYRGTGRAIGVCVVGFVVQLVVGVLLIGIYGRA